jgi:superfamily II DNA or RNA helicase
MITITYLNPIYCQISKDGIDLIRPVLSYTSTFWQPGRFHKIERVNKKFMITRDGRFYTGFLNRVCNYLEQVKKINFTVIGLPENDVNQPVSIEIPGGITLRPEQEEALQSILTTHRGVIHYPTGSGKTLIFLLTMLNYKEYNALVICHTKDLLMQTYNRAMEMFPGEVGIIGDGRCEPDRITIAMIQSLNKFEESEFHKSFGIVIVDEAHHCSKIDGTYANLLKIITAPIRLGFTATIPTSEESKLCIEGLIGPIIAMKKIEEVKSLAKVIIKLRKVPYSKAVHDLSKYQQVYELGVIYNTKKNMMILEDTQDDIAKGKSVLIYVTSVEHGNILMELSYKKFPQLSPFFIWSGTPSSERQKARKQLDNKIINLVIADQVWKEGVDIPSLDVIINAAGGKAEIQTLQLIGRGVRTTDEKKVVTIRDYFDGSHRFLIGHFGERISLYFDRGWL